MYLSHYQLKHKPFQISTDPKFLWLGEKHQEALATLEYGVLDNKGFLLLTGDVGTGKTTLINALLHKLHKDTFAAFIRDPALDPLDFFQYAAHAFGMKSSNINSKVSFLIQFEEFLLKAYESRRKVLLIIDEAQRMSQELLEEVRLLSNIEREDSKLLNIFFVGQIEVNDLLMLESNRAIRQRISLNYNIEALSEKEVREYIDHRLQIASSKKIIGCFSPIEKFQDGQIVKHGYQVPLPKIEQKIFSDDAIHEIFLFSQGFPRLINIICDRAMLTGFVESVPTVTARHIIECGKELTIQPSGKGAGQEAVPKPEPKKIQRPTDKNIDFSLGQREKKQPSAGNSRLTLQEKDFSLLESSENNTFRLAQSLEKPDNISDETRCAEDESTPALWGVAREERSVERSETIGRPTGIEEKEEEKDIYSSSGDIMSELSKLVQYADEIVESHSSRLPVSSEGPVKRKTRRTIPLWGKLVAGGGVVVLAVCLAAGIYFHKQSMSMSQAIRSVSNLWKGSGNELETITGTPGPTTNGGSPAREVPAATPGIEGVAKVQSSASDTPSASKKVVVSFQDGDFLPQQDSLLALSGLADSLSDFSSYEISIIYFTDRKGDSESDARLASQANVIKSYLMGRGVEESRIVVQRFTKNDEAGESSTYQRGVLKMEVWVTQ